MPRRHRLPAPILVLVTVCALAAIAVAPRGMLRAAVADDLAAEHRPSEAPAVTAPADEVDLPGVRALVAREEDDGDLVVADVLLASLPAELVAEPAALTQAPPADAAVPAAPAPRSPHGDRAPPHSI